VRQAKAQRISSVYGLGLPAVEQRFNNRHPSPKCITETGPCQPLRPAPRRPRKIRARGLREQPNSLGNHQEGESLPKGNGDVNYYYKNNTWTNPSCSWLAGNGLAVGRVTGCGRVSAMRYASALFASLSMLPSCEPLPHRTTHGS